MLSSPPMAAPQRLVLIDGSALIFRAYFAIPSHFTTGDGLHTNAIYGFTTMFRKLLSGRTPDYGAVIFDAPGPTFRDDRYPAYKAQRPRMDDDLAEQLPWIDEVVAAHRFPSFRVPGFEADDVIGTLARVATERGLEVLIVSGDKDFAQLVDERVRMLDPIRDVTYDAELVRKKWGVPPRQFVDLLALMGDKVDNIPGVPGIGQKGAAGLLEAWGDLDAILANTGALKGRQKATLEENAERARLSRELATIDVNVPLEIELDALRYAPPNPSELNALYRRLEFWSLLSEEAKDERATAEQDAEAYELVADEAALTARLAGCGVDGPAALHAVFDGPYATRGAWVGLAVAPAPGRAFYLPLGAERPAPAALAAWLADPSRAKVAHEARRLIVVLERHGLELQGLVGDPQLASFLLDPQGLIPHRLDQVVKASLHRTVRPEKAVLGSGQKARPWSAVPVDEACNLACHYADLALAAWLALEPELDAAGQRAQLVERDLPLSYVVARMERTGILVDPEDLATLGASLRVSLAEHEARVHALAGRSFNLASTKQLGELLFDELGLPVIKKTKSGYSTDAEVLERLAPEHEIARVLLEHRKLAKLINTYTDVLQREIDPADGRIHASFQQTVGVSGRLITTDPDLQRTPIRSPEGRRIRRAFVAPAGARMVSADWSQIELRVLAHFSRDEALCEAFRTGADVHRRTASELFGVPMDEVTPEQRDTGKTINFATIYGQGATALGQILGIPRKDAKRYIDGYFEAYAGVRAWRDATIERAHADGAVTTLLGRRRIIAELKSNNWQDRQAGERIAVNTPIQGSAADLCKLAMLAIDAELRSRGLGARMVLQIHDELLLEVPDAEVEETVALVRRHMEQPTPPELALGVPLVVDVGVGASWSEAH